MYLVFGYLILDEVFGNEDEIPMRSGWLIDFNFSFFFFQNTYQKMEEKKRR